MTFFKNSSAQNNLQAILYLMGTTIFGFRQNLGLWRQFKEGSCHLVPCFATTCFQTPITLACTFWTFSILKMIVLNWPLLVKFMYFQRVEIIILFQMPQTCNTICPKISLLEFVQNQPPKLAHSALFHSQSLRRT